MDEGPIHRCQGTIERRFAADSDDRVDPMHGRKFVAAMQYASSGRPVLLSVQRNAGHMGTDAIKSWVSDEADIYAFASSEMGIP